jgi:hypothetical protein
MVSPQPSSLMNDALDDTALSQTGSGLSKERLSAMLGSTAHLGPFRHVDSGAMTQVMCSHFG